MGGEFCLFCPNETVDIEEQICELNHPANLIVSISATIFGLAGLPGNIYLILMIGKNFSKRKQYEWLLFNLALIHTILCMNNLFLQSQYIGNFQSVGCQVAGFVNYFFTILTFCTTPQITVNRYLALYNTKRFETVFKTRNVFLMCTLPWLFATVTCLPFLITDNLGLDEAGLCDVQVTSSNSVLLVLCGFHTPVLLSYCISGYCTMQIVRKLRQHTEKINNELRLASHVIAESRQLIHTIVLLMAIPLVTQIPGVLIKTVQIFIVVHPWVSRTAVAPFFALSAVNAYITLFVIKQYRNTIKSIMKRFSWKKFLFIKSVTISIHENEKSAKVEPKRNVNSKTVSHKLVIRSDENRLPGMCEF